MEKSTQPLDQNSNPIPVLILGTSQLVDGTTAAQSTVFDTKFNKVVRISCVDDVWIKVGNNPQAVSEEGAYFPAGAVEYILVSPNEKLGVIGGKISVTLTK